MEKCSICLKMYAFAINIQDLDKNNVNWLCKLQFIIPELQWLEVYKICSSCTEHINAAWEFKTLVLNLEKDRKIEIAKSEIGSEIDDNFDAESLCDDKQFNCESCPKIFTNQIELDRHNLEIHSDESNIFTCFNCNTNFSKKESLTLHLEKEHEIKLHGKELESVYIDKDALKEHKYNCTICSKLFSTKDNLDSHSKICLNNDDVANLCESLECKNEKEFDSVKDKFVESRQILKRRGRKPLRKFNCEICKEEFPYVKLVTEHCVSVHSMDLKLIKPYSCDLCGMHFGCSANLDQHQSYHSKSRVHICTLCGKGFITKSDLTVHEYTHYNRRNYKCAVCNKAFNTNKNLRTHNFVVHTDRSLWKYICSVCEKRFPLKSNYDQHMRRHTGEKEHACHICKKPFISKSELQRHIHMHSNIRAHKCNYCDKEYKEKRTYEVHLAKKHGIGNAKIAVREKKFVCHICPSQFYDKQKLMRHICSHSGIKPFPCYICDKKFTDKSYLKQHLKTAHNIVEQSNITD